MGLIKKDQIEEKGIVIIEKRAPAASPRPVPKPRPPVIAPEPKKPSVEVKGMDMGKVKSEAQKIIDDAIKEAEALREDARAAGREEGMAEAAKNIEEALETLNQAVKERKKIIKDSEQEILRLSLKIAEQIIRSEVSLHRDVCLNIVAEAIARVSDREQIIVKVNRDDLEYLKRYKDRLTGMIDGVKSFSIIEDANIEPGGCVIETSLGFVDAKISTKLKSIEEALKKVSLEEMPKTSENTGQNTP
jgi:flagellar biosynthesis/type III secretory pathway protein FliH